MTLQGSFGWARTDPDDSLASGELLLKDAIDKIATNSNVEDYWMDGVRRSDGAMWISRAEEVTWRLEIGGG